MIVIKRDIGRPQKNHQDIKKIIKDTDNFFIRCLNGDYFSRYLIVFVDDCGYHEDSYEYIEQSDLDKIDMKWLYSHKGYIDDMRETK